MKRIQLLAAASSLCLSVLCFAAPKAAVPAAPATTEWTVDGGHSKVGFNIRHLVSRVSGEFKEYTGEFTFDEKKPADSKIKMKINAKSINTNNDKRDEHLRGPDFFDTEKCPDITFDSKKITAISKTKGKVTGDLTMRCTTRPVTLDVEYGGMVKDPWGNNKAGFQLTGKVNRKDFGINWNKALDNGGVMLSDDVTLDISVEAGAKKPEEKK